MVLIQLKNYLQRSKMASFAALSKVINAEPDMIKDMLEFWIRKGYVKQCTATSIPSIGCNGCRGSKCNLNADKSEIYEWVGEGHKIC